MASRLPRVSILSLAELASLASSTPYDSTILILSNTKLSSLRKLKFAGDLQDYADMDAGFEKNVSFVSSKNAPGGRMIISPTGPLARDYDDVRRYADATAAAFVRAKVAGIKRPLLIVQPYSACEKLKLNSPLAKQYEKFAETALLAALAATFEPIEVREAARKSAALEVEEIGFMLLEDDGQAPSPATARMVEYVLAIESGRRLAKDIGSPDAERMTSLIAAETIVEHFKNTPEVKVTVIRDGKELKENYPLLMAVARASEHVPRHAPCVVHLEYRSRDQSQVQEELYMIGKGINFDTGGADIKHGGAMTGMSRDKCGAAAVAGFLATCARLHPANINVTADLAFVRNSIGSNAYTCDEVITSRAGVRVLIGNTDAEGRMVMADLLAHMKERALANGNLKKARLLTCATLTGHVVRAYGPYAGALDNGPASLLGVARRIQAHGHLIGDLLEVSTLRREDYAFIAPTSSRYDALQANNLPSTMTNRGHQFPMAFLIAASGLDKYGLDNDGEELLAYTHLDIAGAAEEGLGPIRAVTGAPVAALTATFIPE